MGYNALPEEVIDRVKYLTLDYLGVAALGSLSESSAPILNFVSNRCMVREGAVVIGTDLKADPTYAALANERVPRKEVIEFLEAAREQDTRAIGKIESFKKAGIHVAESFSDIVKILREVI